MIKYVNSNRVDTGKSGTAIQNRSSWQIWKFVSHTNSNRNAALGISGLLARRGNRVKPDEPVEAGGGPAQHAAHPKGEKPAGARCLCSARHLQSPVGEVGLDEAGDYDKGDNAEVEDGEEVVETGGLLHTHA